MFRPTAAFKFLPSIIRNEVEDERIGVYVLGNYRFGEFKPMYVGRSDSCIKHRLLTHNHLYRFQYFCFTYVETEEQAFYLESLLWHNLQEDNLIVNKIHPDSPNNLDLACPYCEYAIQAHEFLLAG